MAVVKDHSTEKRRQSLWDFTKQFPDSITVERWLYQEKVYVQSMKCKAGYNMSMIEISKNGHPQLVWKCTHRPCEDCNRQQKSLREGSFFSGLKIGMHQVLGIIWLYLYKVEMKGIRDLTGASAPTVRTVIHLLYRLMNADIKDEYMTIGGKDSDGNSIIVEVDESKFGKRKSHRGHRVEGVWVVGGVEKTPERKLFLTTVEDRKKDTLHLILGNYIKAGSEIRTDCWKGYCGLSRLSGKQYRHMTVNHAKEFKTVTGVHTNTIEGTWNGIKSLIRTRHRTAPTMKYRLAEFIFRRKHANDLWGGVVKALKEVSFDKFAAQDDVDEEFIYTEVRRECADLDHDDSEFGDEDGWETETKKDVSNERKECANIAKKDMSSHDSEHEDDEQDGSYRLVNRKRKQRRN
ncbi:hypothetical protein O0I10_013188 [Lichtheimia ornata]|uniref:ISXO2-like transposase domain-containing protein n=1 Tax=Lichtheimia ornata TaxID=688661 RepID=A0AAD7XP13_9FUNG|nr:uncharacterized protein O0I10_013188 [Lichtheimia ornata]KAJ8651319.1 hypothetical protein O0I10_013188 [Lichtheimia ornata]